MKLLSAVLVACSLVFASSAQAGMVSLAEPIAVTFEYSEELGAPKLTLFERDVAVEWEELPDKIQFAIDISQYEEWDTVMRAGMSIRYTPPKDSQIRVSYPRINAQLTLQDIVTGRSLFSGSVDESDFLGGAAFIFTDTIPFKPSSHPMRLTGNLSFEGGAHLLPSKDPACISTSCMLVARDNLDDAYLGVFVTNVPEPSTWMLLLVGGVFVATQRRRQMRIER